MASGDCRIGRRLSAAHKPVKLIRRALQAWVESPYELAMPATAISKPRVTQASTRAGWADLGFSAGVGLIEELLLQGMTSLYGVCRCDERVQEFASAAGQCRRVAGVTSLYSSCCCVFILRRKGWISFVC